VVGRRRESGASHRAQGPVLMRRYTGQGTASGSRRRVPRFWLRRAADSVEVISPRRVSNVRDMAKPHEGRAGAAGLGADERRVGGPGGGLE
jgi:hypothetical protein